ncbi:hypothetical protein ACVBE9_06665 [Eionea flava]
MKRLMVVGLFLILTACSSMQVTTVDPNTGYFEAKKQAVTTVSKFVDLDSIKQLILIPDEDFVKGQINNIGYFDKVMTFDDLEKEIIVNNLQDKVPSVRNKIGINKAAKEYKPFIWFRFDTRGSGNHEYAQFILTDPDTLEDIFVSEIHLDYIWAGVNDQYTWYPLFNEMIKYIEANSQTYRK